MDDGKAKKEEIGSTSLQLEAINAIGEINCDTIM
jgi:hypothetical protein